MRHNIPIYLSDVSISIIKETAVKTVLSTLTLKKEIVKGFFFEDFLKRCNGSIIGKAFKENKIPTSKEYKIYLRIDNIVLLKQLGWGVED